VHTLVGLLLSAGRRERGRRSDMAVRKGKAGANLKRWFKEKWTDQNGRPCGSKKTKGVKKCRPSKRVSKNTPKTWKQVGKKKKALVAEKRRVGMGRRTKKA
jgi:hypothetical protein